MEVVASESCKSGDLAVIDLTACSGVLTLDTDGVGARLDKASVVKNEVFGMILAESDSFVAVKTGCRGAIEGGRFRVSRRGSWP